MHTFRTAPAALMIAAAVAITLTGCQTPTAAPSPHTHPTATTTESVSAPPPVTTDGPYTLLQEPQAGYGAVYAQIEAAKKSVQLEDYELTDPRVITDLIAAKQRGVTVQVELDTSYNGGAVNQYATATLTRAGVSVVSPRDPIVHAKILVIDGSVADIMTGNLTPKYYGDTLDAILEDRNPTQVSAISQTLTQDFTVAPSDTIATNPVEADGLVWSPDGNTPFENIAAHAPHILVMSEEVSDQDFSANLLHPGADVLLPAPTTDDADDYLWVPEAAHEGAHIFEQPSTSNPYPHEKMLIANNNTLIIGSTNISYASLNLNRELNIELTRAQAPNIITECAQEFRYITQTMHPAPAN